MIEVYKLLTEKEHIDYTQLFFKLACRESLWSQRT